MASKYMIYDVISSLKSMVVNYAYSLNEASSPCIYEEYLDQFLTLSKITKELFYYAYNNIAELQDSLIVNTKESLYGR